MKKLLNIILIVSFSTAGCYSSGQISRPDNYDYSNNYDNNDVSYETFYNQLQPYGNWINYPGYGSVWQPYASQAFRPYETGGHWVSTVDGWAWASDYNWGWAPFHYGRWLYDQSIGWAWVPGYEWAPAWVTWGQYNDYYAWAPLAPGINISFGNTWRAPADYWCFVPRNYINYSNLNRYAVSGYNTNVNNITIINNYNSYNQKDYYHRGPDYREVERYTHRTITPVGIASTQQPGPSKVVRKELEIYRPSRANNISSGGTNLPNQTKQYNGSISNNSATNGNTTQPNTIRNHEDLNLKNASGDNRGTLSNGIDNSGNNVTQRNIDNSNRQLQQQRIENLKRQSQQYPANDQLSNQQNNVRQQQVIRNNPIENIQPTRPQPQIQNERNIQRPTFPSQNERIVRPGAAMPNRMEAMPRMERREAPPARSMQIERPASRPQRQR